MRYASLLIGVFGLAATIEPVLPRFSDVTNAAGVSFRHQAGSLEKNYLIETTGSGVALFDYNNDDLLDIFFASPSGSRLYKNLGSMRFSDVTVSSKIVTKGFAMGTAAGDFDNDGWTDLYITAYPQNFLLRNNGDGTFLNITSEAGVEGGNWSTGAAWGDYDSDGDIDLYVARYVDFDPAKTPKKGADPSCKYRGALVACGPRGLPGLSDLLYRNNGDGTFTDVTAKTGIRDPGYYGFTVLWLDHDLDGRLDIFVANDATPNFLWRNNGDGTFTDVGAESGVAYNENGVEQACMGATAADMDNDGRPDIFVTNFADDDNTIYQNSAGGFFSDTTRKSGLAGKSWLELGWGAGLVDFDNDGWRDLFVANGHIYPEVARIRTDTTYLQKTQLFRNTGAGAFEEITRAVGPDLLGPRNARGASFGDLDNDGCVDVVLNNIDSPAAILRNECGSRHRWIAFKLQGVSSNRDAIGAKVTVHAGGVSQTGWVSGSDGYIGTSDRRLWFGLGVSKVDRVEILWPSGRTQDFQPGALNRIYKIQEGR